MCEHNETQNVIKAEQHAMKFEETVDNIKRQQKAEEFRQAQCVAVTPPCCCAPLSEFCLSSPRYPKLQGLTV